MSIKSRARPLFWALLPLAALSINSCKGPTGPEGIAGTPGEPGSPALAGLQIPSVQATVAGGNSATNFIHLRVECPAGTKVIAGGFRAEGNGSQFVSAFNSFPVSPTAWQVSLLNIFVGPVQVTAYATCLTAS